MRMSTVAPAGTVTVTGAGTGSGSGSSSSSPSARIEKDIGAIGSVDSGCGSGAGTGSGLSLGASVGCSAGTSAGTSAAGSSAAGSSEKIRIGVPQEAGSMSPSGVVSSSGGSVGSGSGVGVGVGVGVGSGVGVGVGSGVGVVPTSVGPTVPGPQTRVLLELLELDDDCVPSSLVSVTVGVVFVMTQFDMPELLVGAGTVV